MTKAKSDLVVIQALNVRAYGIAEECIKGNIQT